MTSTAVLDTDGNLLGFAAETRNGRLHLCTSNGLDLVADAANLDQAREVLAAHEAWVRSR